MSSAAARVGVGTRFVYAGETVEIVEMHGGTQVTARGLRTKTVQRFSLRELLDEENSRLLCTEPGPASDDDQETAAIKLAFLTKGERKQVVELADHIREVLTGFRSGYSELARHRSSESGGVKRSPYLAASSLARATNASLPAPAGPWYPTMY
jgi:hypothetical protein